MKKFLNQATLQTFKYIKIITPKPFNKYKYKQSQQFKIKKVLIIDDDMIMSHSISEYLSKNFLVHTCVVNDATDGMNQILNHTPDLIFLDWILPNITGIEILKSIKRNKNHKNIPIIMISGNRYMHHFETAIEHGADDYLTKPLNFNSLFDKSKNILRTN